MELLSCLSFTSSCVRSEASYHYFKNVASISSTYGPLNFQHLMNRAASSHLRDLLTTTSVKHCNIIAQISSNQYVGLDTFARLWNLGSHADLHSANLHSTPSIQLEDLKVSSQSWIRVELSCSRIEAIQRRLASLETSTNWDCTKHRVVWFEFWPCFHEYFNADVQVFKRFRKAENLPDIQASRNRGLRARLSVRATARLLQAKLQPAWQQA